MSEKKDKTPYFDSMMELKTNQDEIVKSLVGIFGIFQIIYPKISSFVSKSEKQIIEEQLKFLGKTIIRLNEE